VAETWAATSKVKAVQSDKLRFFMRVSQFEPFVLKNQAPESEKNLGDPTARRTATSNSIPRARAALALKFLRFVTINILTHSTGRYGDNRHTAPG
jgi:hypothetical protein